MEVCNWEKGCKNKVLRDGLCCRHLKQQCSICFEDVGSINTSTTKRLSCGHSYHINCILNWFVTSNECPVCRASQDSDQLILFKEKVENELRVKYKDAIDSMEQELGFLRMQSFVRRAISEDEPSGLLGFRLNYAEIID